jgi:carboxymethylenebutenolidase
MAPGIAATSKNIELPHVGVVEFRCDKIAHEHIHWNQASFLKQIGVLDARGLPVAGIESAKKFVDEQLPSNEMMPQWKRNR